MSYTCIPDTMIETNIICVISDNGKITEKNVFDQKVEKIAIKRPGGALSFFLPATANTQPVELIDIGSETPSSTAGWVAGLPKQGKDSDYLYELFDCVDESTGKAVVILTRKI